MREAKIREREIWEREGEIEKRFLDENTNLKQEWIQFIISKRKEVKS